MTIYEFDEDLYDQIDDDNTEITTYLEEKGSDAERLSQDKHSNTTKDVTRQDAELLDTETPADAYAANEFSYDSSQNSELANDVSTYDSSSYRDTNYSDNATYLIQFSEGHKDSTSHAADITTLDIGLADNAITATRSSYDFPTASEIGWHHDAINSQEAWVDYTGKGVVVAVIDSGWSSFNHADLNDNIRFDLADYSALNGDSHGQSTIGIIGAEANGSQVVGVAYNADLVPELWGLQGVTDATKYADVMNNSWGIVSPFNTYVVEEAHSAVTYGRDGLGSVVVVSSGNFRQADFSSNLQGFQNSPDTITVGATNEDGTAAVFSSEGSSLLVTAPGVNLSTTDGATGITHSFSGTSGSAPVVSGVAALILEANDELGYRDVHQILAYSTQFNDSENSTWQYNGADNWNGGGLHFSNDHGFGLVDARAAVRLAETWQEQNTVSNMESITGNLSVNQTIPDNGNVLQTTIQIGALDNILIETVVVNVDINDHGQVGDLIIELISPNGTVSTLMDTPLHGNAEITFETGETYIYTELDYDFTAQNFRGEHSAGEWTLQVRDVETGNVGILSDWSLEFNGSSIGENNTYFYSDDFATFNSSERVTLTDTGGNADTINASMVTSDMVIDLTPGSINTVASRSLTINASTLIENIYAGDGNDILTGNASNNLIWGGRGSDTIDGGEGYDIAQFLDGLESYTLSFDGATIIAELADTFIDTINNVEEFIFDGVSYLYTELHDMFSGGGENVAPELAVENGSIEAGTTVSASDYIQAIDADGDAVSYRMYDAASAGSTAHYLLHGEEVANYQVLSSEDFANLQIVAGANEGSQTFWVQTKDAGHDWSTWQSFAISVAASLNEAPTVNVQNGSLEAGSAVAASEFINATDPDGDEISYILYDYDITGSAVRFTLNGEEVSNSQVMSAEDFANLQIVAGSNEGSHTLWVQVVDSNQNLSAWKSFDISVTPSTEANEAPLFTVQDTTLEAGSSIAAAELIQANDADGDAITYRLYDYDLGGSSAKFMLNGAEVLNYQVLTETEFANLQIVASEDNTGESYLWVQVKDADHDWGTWEYFGVNVTPVNQAPDLAVENTTMEAGSTIAASEVITATDKDGDAILYRVIDNSESDDATRFLLNGENVTNNQELTAAEFASLQIKAGNVEGSAQLSVQVKDAGHEWSNLEIINVETHVTAHNDAPTLYISDGSMNVGDVVSASEFINSSDPDGDAISYKVYDYDSSYAAVRFMLNGEEVGNNQELMSAEFSDLQIVAHESYQGDGYLWVQIKDADHDWGAWEYFTVNVSRDASNQAPELAVTDGALEFGEKVSALEFIHVSDKENDELSFQLWDNSNTADGTRFVLNGQEVNDYQVISYSDFADLEVQAGTQGAGNQLWLQVKDADHDWSSWASFYVTASATNGLDNLVANALNIDDVLHTNADSELSELLDVLQDSNLETNSTTDAIISNHSSEFAGQSIVTPQSDLDNVDEAFYSVI